MPPHVQAAIERSLKVNLGGVSMHTGDKAGEANRVLNSSAFTVGKNIFLGTGVSPTNLRILGHEAAHVVQQQQVPAIQRFASVRGDAREREADRASDAVVSGEPFTVSERVAGPAVQRLGLSDALDYVADKANLIPGFRMFTIVLGVNPVNMSHVDRSPANIMRAVVEFIPGGALITQALDKYGVFDKVGAWVDQQLATLKLVGGSIKSSLDKFLDSLGLRDLVHPGDAWERAKHIFTDPIDRIKSFVSGLVDGIIKFVKDAILMPLAELASQTRGWDLLIAVLGKNPITGEKVPQDAETIVGGFMKLIGEEELWANVKKANALSRVAAWFKTNLATLLDFVSQVPSLFIDAIKSLTLEDIILLPRAFKKVATVFGNFVGRFVTWAGNAVWSLLQIIFEVVAPGAVPYLKKLGGAFKSILKNPIGFVGNLVKAGKLGFLQFADNIGAHLKASLVEWLTGTLTGVYLPKSFELKEIAMFVLSALGLTWQNIRQKLVKALGEPAVKAMEAGFDIVVTLVKDGPAAAWDKIKEHLSSLKDMVIAGIMDFVVTTIVKKAVEKVISLLVPGGAFIQAIISIYDTIMVFVSKLSKIMQVAMAFLDSMMEIAAGAIGGAAKKVESTLAGLLTLAISFLAGFLGLGKIGEKVIGIIGRVRDTADKALDKAVDWIVSSAKTLFSKIFGKGDKPDERTDAQKKSDLDRAVAEVENLQQAPDATEDGIRSHLPAIKRKYSLVALDLVIDKEDDSGESVHVSAEINPKANTRTTDLKQTKGFTMEEILAEYAEASNSWASIQQRALAEEDLSAKYVGSVYELHHLLVQQFRSRFEAGRLKIDRWTVKLSTDEHKWIHKDYEWNQQWREFFASFRAKKQKPSDSEILSQLRAMAHDFGLEGLALIDYRTKQKTGRTL